MINRVCFASLYFGVVFFSFLASFQAVVLRIAHCSSLNKAFLLLFNSFLLIRVSQGEHKAAGKAELGERSVKPAECPVFLFPLRRLWSYVRCWASPRLGVG